MTAPLLAALPGNEMLCAELARRLGGEIVPIELRHFPDEETYLRFDTPVEGRSLILVCTLDRPDTKFLPLLFAAGTARDLGAARIGLVAPYLAYLRQDRRFNPGEALTSALFGQALSAAVDWLIAVDPHLHRIAALESLFTIPAHAVHAAPLIAAWIRTAIPQALLIGPDEESAQWVSAIAAGAGAPFVILRKKRLSDRAVEISIPELERWRAFTPVLVDDIISSGRTMIETLAHLKRSGMKPAACVGVHAVFANGAYEALLSAGAVRIVTTNTIPHPTNTIDVVPLLADAIASLHR
jgi:ribose-phosphate pyrophosphokinase